MPYVRESFRRGETFLSLDDAQRRAAEWCRGRAARRTHGTTRRRPAEVFEAEERSQLLPAPGAPYEVPEVLEPTVRRDPHVVRRQAPYSVCPTLSATSA